MATDAVYPASTVSEKRNGWGCILLDTTLSNTSLASDAVIKESGDMGIFGTHWLQDSEGNFYGVGFTFDKLSANASVTMKAVSGKIRNDGAEGRQMDGNPGQPNFEDKKWSY